MRNVIKNIPIPTGGVALGLVALGTLLRPYSEVITLLCALFSLVLVVLLAAKVALFPRMIQDDLHNSVLASVSATSFMAIMQLAAYVAPLFFVGAFIVWAIAVLAHLILMVWFTLRFITRFQLKEVFPTYFICYVGIIVASVTSPAFGMEVAGYALFWLGFVLYALLLAVVSYRYLKHEAPEATRPLFCIYAAPMSLSLVGYLATAAQPSVLFVGVLMILAQFLFAIVLARLPLLLRLKFYPSYAAMTFPFVITATALGKGLAYLRAQGIYLPEVLDVLVMAETLLAAVMVLYVFGHYLRFFVQHFSGSPSATLIRENRLTARFARYFRS